VIQREGKFGGAGGHLNGLPAQNEEVTFSICTVYSPGADIFDEK